MPTTMSTPMPTQDDASSSAQQRRCVRILGRRYPLTITEHKYLEIGINAGFTSYVEIAIGDKRGNEVLFSLETWKGLMEHEQTIQEYYLSKDKKKFTKHLYIGQLKIEFVIFNNMKCIRLELNNVRIIMVESTINCIFKFDKCIDHMYNWLVSYIDNVDRKFRYFSNITLNINNPNDIIDTIQSSEYFNSNDLTDCELLALAF